ncbi:DinB family protein [Micromonospora sp. NBC_01655]|uniref:mycothiol transferase n=1 Tax=Micromonospora sp. NBC_01655 TaxID=2975983 RepID=UPI00224E57D8|nr:DUF664 domain-containing protein [Micromonospora sp. NBC_01655]MCX4471312.1 DinB family protein [Micromonospora sp. NBC_01655]
MTTARPLDSEELASTAAERELLEDSIDAYRDVITAKLRGLSEDDARRSLVPSLTTLIGLVKHAAAVERNWFQHCLEQQPREQWLRLAHPFIDRLGEERVRRDG